MSANHPHSNPKKTHSDMEVQPFTNLQLPRNRHEAFTMILLTHGTVFIEVDATMVLLSAPCVLCLHERRRVQVKRQHDCQGYLFCFKPTVLNINMTLEAIRHPEFEHLAERHSLFQLAPFLSENLNRNILSISQETLKALTDCLEHCRQELLSPTDWYWSCRTRSYFMDLLRILENLYFNYGIQSKAAATPRQHVVSQEFRQILEYVDSHIEQPLSLSDLAARFHTYRKQIESLFSRFLDMTYYEYIRKERLKKVCYYLRFTELRAKEIALRVGFSSSQNLAKFFKKEKNMSMLEFRRQCVAERKSDGELTSISGRSHST